MLIALLCTERREVFIYLFISTFYHVCESFPANRLKLPLYIYSIDVLYALKYMSRYSDRRYATTPPLNWHDLNLLHSVESCLKVLVVSSIVPALRLEFINAENSLTVPWENSWVWPAEP